ncbi:mandelate racemase/muconate lactonizing enzyme family protein [Microbispora catharanthi]|uniref:Dipeptide epimerase n=1 Tax=Microbispora catharanthi TaxID=1712871 RepID=A0A5N6BLZ3_9ACTN|nr:dipeptide epimerase [Microbispora catharanthi]KAB8181198.1 dipeptide epimerase [Microbispora catharanthi]
MTIAAVHVHRLVAPLHTPFVTALAHLTHVSTVVVEIVDRDGRSGFGEAPEVWTVTGSSLASSEACVTEAFAPLLIGRNADDLVENCRRVSRAVIGNEPAKAAVDIALHDLAAVRLGVPLVRLLGGSRLVVPTDVSLAAGTVDSLATAAKSRAAEGFDVLKVKVGTDAATDVNRVTAVRQAVGPEVRIRLDANQGWTPREAVRVIRSLEDAGMGVEFVEQPVNYRDMEGLAWVSDRVETPIMADESVFDVHDLVEVIRRRAADLINVKLAKSGGLSAARTLLELTRAQGMGTILGSMLETEIGTGAAASLVAAYGTTMVSDLDAVWWLQRPAVVGGMRYQGAAVVLPDAPGLGISGLVAAEAREATEARTSGDEHGRL